MPETVVHFQIRMSPYLHEQLSFLAQQDKASLNALIVGILEKALERRERSRQSNRQNSWRRIGDADGNGIGARLDFVSPSGP
jgi:hypothetical protein